ncbi:MAG TPA: hypothetical protein VNL37_02470, partial [Candidatus Polarisedimenticolia bacterium]|nr:hypothetical protein [Candidatus Polarisedimenticolia bacterium]
LLRNGVIAAGLSVAGGNVWRDSFRDPPRLGLSNLIVSPGGAEGIADRCLRVDVARLLPGSTPRLLIRQGAWEKGGAPAGAADGIVWEGRPESLLRGLRVAPGEARRFHPGLPVLTPPLLVESPGRFLFPAHRPDGARAPRPTPPPQRGAEE